MRIFVDIDGTICETPWYNGAWDYKGAYPNKLHIEKINKLFDEGNEIVYWTARGRMWMGIFTILWVIIIKLIIGILKI